MIHQPQRIHAWQVLPPSSVGVRRLSFRDIFTSPLIRLSSKRIMFIRDEARWATAA